MKKTLISIVAFAAGILCQAQWLEHPAYLRFEDRTILEHIQAGKGRVSISTRHYREGESSLRWDYARRSPLLINVPVPFEYKDETGADTYLSSFVAWVYCEKALKEPLTFEFLKNGKVCSHFTMNTGFTGWRGLCASFERDMQGTPEPDMDAIRIIPPKGSGTIYIDYVISASKIDSRYHSPDEQMPFVNPETDNHWLLIYKHSLWKPDLALEPLTEEQVRDMHVIEERFRAVMYEPRELTTERMEKLRTRHSFYKIKYSEGIVTGRPVFMVRQSETFERLIGSKVWDKDMFTKMGVEFSQYFKLMLDIALAYNDAKNDADRSELRAMFMSMYDYITDTGVAAGSSWGYCHHYGYNIRGLYPAYLLMKDVLKEEGRLDEAARTMQWYAITNEILPAPKAPGVVIDAFNTQMEGMFSSILIMNDSPEKARLLKSFTRWVDNGCALAPGLTGSFKPDGSCFHHCNNYPAYAVGGLEGVTKAIYFLSGTEFKVKEESHQTIKNTLLTMRFYSNTLQWPLSMSGRHPNGSWTLQPEQFAIMAIAGTPDGSEAIDSEMAAAYMRLNGVTHKRSSLEKSIAKTLKQSGIPAEKNPQGNIALGYGCTSVQRRGNSMAVVRGHNRYIWASEHYLPANFHGRYLAHGSMELLTGPKGKPVSLESSGWMENGFDWNRIPGTTSVHIPFEMLRARVLNVDRYSGFEEMLYSDEAFAGGLSAEGRDGNFGMILHEHDKYDGTLRARKSWHFFNNIIVCLGSAIEDGDAEHNTETTIFQLASDTPERKDTWSNCSGNDPFYIDYNNTGYYIGEQSRPNARFCTAYPQITVWERKEGQSSGDWASLVIDHGKAPSEASYEYAVVMNTGYEQMQKFSQNPKYKVLEQNRKAHIVSSNECKSVSYVLFEAANELDYGTVAAADTSCLIIERHEGKEQMVLSVCQPDLALYRGPSDDVYDQDGKRIERSIYSRPWIGNESGEIPVRITLRGKWIIEDAPSNVTLANESSNSVVTIICKHASSFDIKLKR